MSSAKTSTELGLEAVLCGLACICASAQDLIDLSGVLDDLAQVFACSGVLLLARGPGQSMTQLGQQVALFTGLASASVLEWVHEGLAGDPLVNYTKNNCGASDLKEFDGLGGVAQHRLRMLARCGIEQGVVVALHGPIAASGMLVFGGHDSLTGGQWSAESLIKARLCGQIVGERLFKILRAPVEAMDCPLTVREKAIMEMKAGGLKDKQVAGSLQRSFSAVRLAERVICAKLGVKTMSQGIALCASRGWLNKVSDDQFSAMGTQVIQRPERRTA